MDSLEARVSGMGKLLLEIAVECDELNEELRWYRKIVLVQAVMNLIFLGIVVLEVVR